MIPITIEPATKTEPTEHHFKNGDILFGEKYVQPKTWENEYLLDRPYIWLGTVSHNPWKSLKMLGIDFKTFRDDVAYQCECDEVGNTYYWMMPRVIIPSDFDAWKKRMKELKIPFDVMDYEFHRFTRWGFRREEDREKALNKISIHPGPHLIPGVMMGHGYPHGFLPSDGDPVMKTAIVQLSDGSDMICSSWVWYNK